VRLSGWMSLDLRSEEKERERARDVEESKYGRKRSEGRIGESEGMRESRMQRVAEAMDRGREGRAECPCREAIREAMRSVSAVLAGEALRHGSPSQERALARRVQRQCLRV